MKKHMRKLILLFILLICSFSIASATDYYVATDGNNENPGTESEPWDTITYAATQAQAGDTVYIKGGNYGHEHVVISNSGTSENSIVFEGYDGIPLLDGQDRTGNGIYVSSKDYIEIKNIKVTQYEYGVRLSYSDYIMLDNIDVINIGGSGYNGWGIYLSNSDYNEILNCNVTDARGVNFHIWHSNYNLVENCTSYGIETANAVDYYIVIQYSHSNIIRNCISENKHRDSTAHPGHGIGIKDVYYSSYSTPHSYNNTITDCESHGHGEHFYVAHPVYNNEFINCTAYNDNLNDYFQWNDGFVVRDGAHDNTFKNSKAVGRLQRGIFIFDGAEGPAEDQIQDNNIFENIIIEGNPRLAAIWLGSNDGPSKDNTFKNIVVNDAPYIYRMRGIGNTGNIMRNSIIYDVSNYNYIESGATGAFTSTYSNFYNNGFSMPSGLGNIAVNPLFINIGNSDYHLKSQYGRWNGSGWVSDGETSPCIDVGDPADSYSSEPIQNGDRINMGAYGNTTEASKSSSGGEGPEENPIGDFDNRMKKTEPNVVFSSTQFLDLGTITEETAYRSLLYFNLSEYSNDTTIENATLDMLWYYNTSTRNLSTNIQVYQPTKDWITHYTTWNNYTQNVAWDNVGGDWNDSTNTQQGTSAWGNITIPLTTADNQYYSITVTDLVQSYINESITNYGFLLKAENEIVSNYVAFRGLDWANSSEIPKLTINTDEEWSPTPNHTYYSLTLPILNRICSNGNVSWIGNQPTETDIDILNFKVVVS